MMITALLEKINNIRAYCFIQHWPLLVFPSSPTASDVIVDIEDARNAKSTDSNFGIEICPHPPTNGGR